MVRKNGILALLLVFLFGFLGLVRFYLRKTKTGLSKMITLGGLGIWWSIDTTLLLVDAFLYSLGKDRGFVKDKRGQDLKYGFSACCFKGGSFRQDWFVNELATVDNESTASHTDTRPQPAPKK